MKIYIVQGITGEYEDYYEWVLCAYADEETAKDHAKRAETRAKESLKEYDTWNLVPYGSNEHDPLMHIDYTGIYYITYSCELIEEDK